MRDGFIKIAAATPDLHVADCAYNTSEIVKLAKEAAAKGAKLITFPELCLTGYTCGDLFLQETLLEGALDALNTVCRETAELAAVIVVGLPLRVRGKLYNVAAVVNAGDVLAFVPKTHLPNYSEFYEQRHFVSADTLSGGMESVDIKNADGETVCVPLVTDTIFQCDEQPLFTFGVEICEDLWVPNPPSTALAQMGAHIIVNLSASDEIIGKAGYRRDLVRQQSGRLLCAYLYADAGFGESTQDLVFAGHDLIAENGALLAESKMFSQGIIYADIDLQRLAHERQRMNTFESIEGGVFSFSLEPVENDLADRTFPRTPFVPANKALRDERCEEILTLQATGLATRLAAVRRLQQRLDGPVFLRHKCADLVLAVHDQTGCNALHTACGQTALDLAPQERRQLIANDSIENAACLLCIYQIDINIARVLDTRADRLLGDLVKGHAAGIFVLELEQLLDMPRNRFSLAVRVSCEIDEIALADFAADFLDDFIFTLDRHIFRLEIVLDIDAHFLFRQIAQMSHRSLDDIVRTEIFSDRLCLGRGLHDD